MTPLGRFCQARSSRECDRGSRRDGPGVHPLGCRAPPPYDAADRADAAASPRAASSPATRAFDAAPGVAGLADGDGIAQRLPVAEHEVEPPLRRADYDGAGLLIGGI